MQALNNFSTVYATFEQAGMKELTEAQHHQDRLRGEMGSSRESFDMALMDMQESMSKINDSREQHDVVCQDLQAADTRTTETKRKAGSTHALS